MLLQAEKEVQLLPKAEKEDTAAEYPHGQVHLHKKKAPKLELKSPQGKLGSNPLSPTTSRAAGSSGKAEEVDLQPLQKVPKVYYATRTHSQLKQVAEELQRCHPIYTKHLNMVILGSRQHLCSNAVVRKLSDRNQTSIDEICQDLLKIRKNIGKQVPGTSEVDESYPDSLKKGCHYLNEKKIELVVQDVYKSLVPPIWDIEALDKLAQKQKGCGYLAMRSLAKEANYILTPYNYLIHPSIRQAMGIDLKDAIVVFDEAHNIEDVAREAGSLDATLDQVVTCLGELQRLGNSLQHIPTLQLTTLVLHVQHFIEDMIQGGSGEGGGGFMAPPDTTNHTTPATSSKQQQQGTGYKSNSSMIGDDDLIWEGNEFVDILNERYQINAASLAVYQEYFKQFLELQSDIEDQLAMRDGNDPQQDNEEAGEEEIDEVPQFLDPEEEFVAFENSENGKKSKKKKKQAAISISSMSLLRNLLSVLGYLLKDDMKFVDDFRIVLQQHEDTNDFYSRGGSSRKKKKSHLDQITLHIWCLSAGVVFQDITSQARSVLLSSGTLSPLDSFAGELATSFPVRVEANHVINLSEQLIVGCVSTLQDHSLSSVYQAQQSDWYLDLLGQVLYLVMRQVPGGVLMFVPSYALLNRLMLRWSQSHSADAGESGDKRGTKKRAFDKKAYNNSNIHLDAEEGSLLGKLQQGLQAQVYFEPKESALMPGMLQDYYKRLDEANVNKTTHSHAAMIAVCRGKVSEGINFSDHYARAVIIIGIPYPSVADKKVDLKKKYQDRKAMSKSNHALFPEETGANNNAAATEQLRHSDGATWYKQQAFRAINQAIGRCIRHKSDYGAILLVDPRYCQGFHNPQTSIISQLSKWLRNEAKVYERLEDLLIPLKSFFQRLNPSLITTTTSNNSTNFNTAVSNTNKTSSSEKVQATNRVNEQVENDDSMPPSKKKQVSISISQCFRRMKSSTSAESSTFTESCETNDSDEEDHVSSQDQSCEEDQNEDDVTFFLDRGAGKAVEDLPPTQIPFSPVIRSSPSSTKHSSQRLFQENEIQDADLLDIDLDFPEQQPVRKTISLDVLFKQEKIQILRDLQETAVVLDLPANLQQLHKSFQQGFYCNTSRNEFFVVEKTKVVTSMPSMQVLQLSNLPAIVNEDGYKVLDRWETSDGVVYRYLLEQVDSCHWSVLAAGIIASSSKISCLQVLDQCYGTLSLLSRLNETIVPKTNSNPQREALTSPFSTSTVSYPTSHYQATASISSTDYVAGPFSTSNNTIPQSDNIADYYSSSYFQKK